MPNATENLSRVMGLSQDQIRPSPQLILPGDMRGRPVASVEATVEISPQKLRTKVMRPFEEACWSIPMDISENARKVMRCLIDCFTKAGEVREGIVKDVLWGFEVSGHSPVDTAYGLVDLKRAGYVGFEAPDGTEVDEHSQFLAQCWLTYKRKLLDIVFGA